LGAGDFFGEIGILNIDGANRRTADVRSVGYSELFSLSKEDVLEGCRDYPEAERKLYEYAQNRLGFEKAKREAAEKMKSAFNTLTSIASCLTQQMTTAPPVAPLAAKKLDSFYYENINFVLFDNSTPKENDKIEEEAPLCRINRRTTTADRIRY
jgi:hypothetical protein